MYEATPSLTRLVDSSVNWNNDLITATVESKRTSTYFTRYCWCLIALTLDSNSSFYTVHIESCTDTHARALTCVKRFHNGNICHMGLSRLPDGSDADLYTCHRRECQTVGLINWQYIMIFPAIVRNIVNKLVIGEV